VGAPVHGTAATNGATIAYTPTLDFIGTDVFTYTISDGRGGLDTAVVTVTVDPRPVVCFIYFPLFPMNYVDAPDLVVEHMTITSDTVQVVIKNQGSMPVTSGFWVDLYVDPDPVPTGVNQIWADGRSDQGAVWAVNVNALPALTPGGMLTLTIGDAYYQADLSVITLPLPAGTPVYAQVDSANYATNYGAVLENHEIAGGAYNNILGPVYSSAAIFGRMAEPLERGILRTPRSTYLLGR
jgi:Bacterial Ig domain